MQLGRLLWLRVRLQAAAHEAARAYVVWLPQDPALALQKAEAAAWLALRPRPGLLSMTVQPIEPPYNGHPLLGNDHWLAGGAHLTQGLRLNARTPLLPGLRFVFPSGARLQADASILNEQTRERNALDGR